VNLYQHQQELLDQNPHKWLIAHDVGTGKSLLAMELAIKNATRCLVICPKGIKKKWQREITDHPNHQKIQWLVLTKEEFRRDWEKLSILIDAVIVDEAHHFSNYSSQMSKNLLKFIRKVQPKCLWLLTGTPYRREPLNIWTLARYLGYDWPFMGFRSKYYKPQYVAYNRMVWVPRDDVKGEMARLVNTIGNTVRIDECADIPPQVFEYEEIVLTPAQKKAVKKVEETETAAIVRFTKIHQIEQGCLKGDEYVSASTYNNNKNDRILELCESADKVAVFCRYNLQVDILKEFLEKKLKDEKPIFVIRGGTKGRDSITLEVDKVDKCVVLITSDTSEGYELPSVGLVVFASMSFSFTSYQQACGRFLRINRLKKNVYVHLITEGESLDRAVLDAILKKQSFDIAIYSREQENVV